MRSLLLRLLAAGLLGCRHLLREHLLHALLLLDQERTHDPHAHALATPRTTIGTIDRALALLQPAVLDRAQRGNANQALLAISTMRALRPLLHCAGQKPSARCADRADLVALGVVGRMLPVGEALDHCGEKCSWGETTLACTP